MIEKHFEELRAVVEMSEGLPETTRSELLRIADQLEREALELGMSQEPKDDAETDREASTAAHGLVSAIEGLEASHPELTAAVNNTAAMLSRLGF